MRALLVSTYDLGRQPFGLASPAAWLRREGIDVRLVDVAKARLTPDDVAGADLVAFHLPMHTATRLAAPVIQSVRAMNGSARVCAYGVYAPLNEEWLRALGVDDVLGGEFEEELARIATMVRDRSFDVRRASFGEAVALSGAASSNAERRTPNGVPRLRFLVPDRSGLPPLSRYATLQLGDGTRRTVGSTEASRGCRHLCRHCPIVPVYDGQFRVVQPDVVLADIAAQVAAGAQHITFGDPDFFNGPTHAVRLVEALHLAHPDVSYDVTIKIEHLLRHRSLLPALRETGCLFVTSAVESLDDRVLGLLAKGHTRADFLAVVELFQSIGMTLVPTFVAFHPWSTLESYCDLLDVIEHEDLVDHVAPIQLAIRLLIPQGSRMLDLDEVRQVAGSFDPNTLTFRWIHRDPEIDRLHGDVASLVGSRLTSERRQVFDAISDLAHERAGTPRPRVPFVPGRPTIPYLSEPWYCCAEPNPEQVALV
jgi:radical SAM superfamily enzyme YgiQ (UPF0313 family)